MITQMHYRMVREQCRAYVGYLEDVTLTIACSSGVARGQGGHGPSQSFGKCYLNLKCKKIYTLNVVGFRRSRKISATTPPPHWICSATGDPGKCMLLPPPHWTMNLVGYRRSRKMYRVTSAAGWPPKQKSWLRRWPIGLRNCNLPWCRLSYSSALMVVLHVTSHALTRGRESA